MNAAEEESPPPGLNVPKGKSLIAGSEDEVKMLGVNAVFVADDVTTGDSLDVGFSSLVGVFLSEFAGEALGDVAL